MFKTLISIVFALVFAGVAQAQVSQYKTLTPNSTSIATATTNSTAGTVINLKDSIGTARLYLTGSGSAGTTNGTLAIDLITASGDIGVTNAFDSVAAAPFTLSLSGSMASTTNTVSTNVNLSGVSYIAIGRVRNTYAGSVSNLTVTIGYPNSWGKP